MRRVARRPSSLDASLSAESITSLGELVPDEAAVIPDLEMVDNNMSTLLHVLIRLLLDARWKSLSGVLAWTAMRRRRLRRLANSLALHASG